MKFKYGLVKEFLVKRDRFSNRFHKILLNALLALKSSFSTLETNSTMPHKMKLLITTEILDVYSNTKLCCFQSKLTICSSAQKLHHLNTAFPD